MIIFWGYYDIVDLILYYGVNDKQIMITNCCGYYDM